MILQRRPVKGSHILQIILVDDEATALDHILYCLQLALFDDIEPVPRIVAPLKGLTRKNVLIEEFVRCELHLVQGLHTVDDF